MKGGIHFTESLPRKDGGGGYTLSSKRRPHFETLGSRGRTQIWSWVLRRPETKNDCVGEGQQKFTELNCTDTQIDGRDL
jgi:hypothetical protein